MKKLTTAFVACVLCFTFAAPTANAQTYYYNYAPQSMEAQIAYLQGVVAQLITQLQLRGFGVQYQYQTGYDYRYQNQNNWYGLGFRVPKSNVDVSTGYAKYSGGEVTLHGEVDLGNASYAYVWFEYGVDDDDMNRDTRKVKRTRDGSFSAKINVNDLRDGKFYYYRAVAEDNDGKYDRGTIRSFYVTGSSGSSSRYKDPVATTRNAKYVRSNSAELHGDVNMNDFKDGYVFFVYGEDERQIEDAEDEDRYRDIRQDGDNLQKVVADNDLDGNRSYWYRAWGLDYNTDHYYRICVEYEDDDDDKTLACGDVKEFKTD